MFAGRGIGRMPYGTDQGLWFDPHTGQVEYFVVMKHRDANTRALWINATWLDQGAKRWVFLENEEIMLNVM